MKKMLSLLVCGIILTGVLTPTTYVFADQPESLANENETVTISPRVGGYIAKNHRQSNYRVTSGWYYVSSFTTSAQVAGNGPHRTYNIFHRKVSYTATYDLYDQYSGRYIRTVSTNVNTKEEQWRLVY